MKTGVPEDFLHGDADNWTPDWAVSLEERFQRTVKAWLRGPTCAKQQAKAAAAKAAPPGFAFAPTVEIRAAIDMRIARANDQQNRRWMSLAELQTRPSSKSRPSALMRRSGVHGHRCPGNSHQMLLGLGKCGFRFRRSIFSASSSPSAGGNSEDNHEGEGDGKCDARASGASILGAADVSIRAKEMLEVNSRTLEDHEPPHDARGGLLSSLFGGATDAYDSAISFVGCVLVTSPLGKRYLNAYDSHISVPTSTTHRGGKNSSSSSSGDGSGSVNLKGGGGYELVGFSNIDPFEASGRRGKRLPNYLLRY